MQADQKKNTEHSNPDNWYFTFYYAPKNPAVIVPKRWGWEYGATLNFAHAEAYLIVSLPFVIAATILACVALFGR